MGKTHRQSGNEKQQKTDCSTNKIVTLPFEDLSRGPNSKFGLLVILIVAVCAVVAVVHWPALSARALSFDDHMYLTDNPLVQNPSWTSAWRFGTEVLEPSTVRGYYQPLTMLSLMIDYALGGRVDNLRQFRRTSLALHIANTALIIVLLYLLFGRADVAAAVGLLFGVHPMTVGPIPWVGERKTLLAAFFALWSLVLYVRFTRKDNWKLYAGSMVAYVLAVLSKPTSVPVPVLLLLLDFWPLKRLKWRTVLEKLPFFVLGLISAVITYVSQSRAALTIAPGEYSPKFIPLVLCHNIIFYLHKIIWPANLSSHYPYPSPLALSNPTVAAGVIGTCILIPLLVVSLRWTRALLTGWLFFIMAIFPTMGVIIFTIAIASDEYAYLPSVGLLMVLTAFACWFCSTDDTAKLARRRMALAITILIVGGAETFATRRYLVHWRDTLGLYEYMLALAPDAAPLHINIGAVLQSQGKIDEAVGHYRKALQINPHIVYAHNNLGRALTLQGKTDEAIHHLRQALQLEPDFAEAHCNLGFVLRSQGKVTEAINHYRQTLQAKPDHPNAHNNLGVALQIQGKFDEAITHYRHALRIKPSNAEAHNNIGTILMQQGKLDEAVSHYRRAMQLRPGSAETYANLGAVFKLQGRLNKAISSFRQALQIKNDDAKVYYNLGLVLAMQGKFDEAINRLRQALQIKPDYAEAHYNLGKALHSQGKLEEAVNSFQEAVDCFRGTDQLNPDLAEAHDNLGYVLMQQGRLDEAITHFVKALEIKPDLAEAHSNFGHALLRQGRFEQAAGRFAEAARIKPDFADAHSGLGRVLALLGKSDKAAIHLRKAIQLNPNIASAHYLLAGILADTGRTGEAIIHFKKALQLRPDWVDAMGSLAWIFATAQEAGLHSPEQAVQLAQRACELTGYQNPRLLDALSAAFAADGRFADAVATAEKALELAQVSQAEQLVEQIQNHLALYKAGKPYIESRPRVTSD